MEQYKIIDLIKHNSGEKFVSFEIIPNVDVPSKKIQIPGKKTLFYSIVWKVASKVDLSKINKENVDTLPPLKKAVELINNGETVLMHLTCIDMTYALLKCILDKAKECQIKNLFILQGDGFQYEIDNGDFPHADDMIKHIRKQYGEYFCIGIAGFPNGHPDSIDIETDIRFLKQKIDAGADFIISQIFFRANDFIDFTKRCVEAGITVPIIPEMCIYASLAILIKVSQITAVKYPMSLYVKVRNSRNIPRDMVEYVADMLKQIDENKVSIPVVHWNTFNHLQLIIELYKNKNKL